jgi:hypothetical protein
MDRCLIDRVRLPQAVVLYEDTFPLSDIAQAEDGAVCCARRVPGLAEVIVWPRGIVGGPISWSGPPSLPILRIFGFTGSEVYACSGDQIFRIGPGAVNVLHTTRGRIHGAWLSPDTRSLLWLEREGGAHGYVARIGDPVRPARLRLEDDCYDARWLTSEEILAIELHHAGDAEAGLSLHICDPGGAVVTTTMRTDALALSCGPTDPAAAAVFLFAHILPRRNARNRSLTGTWHYDVSAMRSTCVANAAPAGGTAVAVEGGCLFADAGVQTAESSRLVFASRTVCSTAIVTGFLREFALAPGGRTLLFRTSGRTFGIAALTIHDLVRGQTGPTGPARSDTP